MRVLYPQETSIFDGVANRLHDVCIINPVRMYAEKQSVLHENLIGMMPNIADSIKQNEEFYKNKPGRYPSEYVILLREIHEKGYKVYTILLDKDSKHDFDILTKAIPAICQRNLPQTTYRVFAVREVLDYRGWEWTKTLLHTHSNPSDMLELYSSYTMELYKNAEGEKVSCCVHCAHRKVCKHLTADGLRLQCENFMSI